MTTDYLNEERLGDILDKLYSMETIVPQNPFNGVKIDYSITFKENNLELASAVGVVSVKGLTMLLEFDGFHHYTQTSQVVKDLGMGLGLCKWNKITETIYGIRIPYFVQLDKAMSKIVFGVDNNLNDYPHGFVDKKAVLPSQFCNYGEKRFVKDLKNLPHEIGKQIFDSMLSKYLYPKKIESAISYDSFSSLVKYFYPEKYELVMNKAEPANMMDQFERMLLSYKKRFEQIQSWLA